MVIHRSFTCMAIAFIAACSPSSTHNTALAYQPPVQQDRRSVLASASAASASLLVSPGSASASASASAASGATAAGGPTVPLDGSTKGFPLASFGLQIYDDSTAYRLTMTALECGYRNFFASVLAGNQKGFAKAIKASGTPAMNCISVVQCCPTEREERRLPSSRRSKGVKRT